MSLFKSYNRIRVLSTVLICVLFLCVSGCSESMQNETQTTPVESGFVIKQPGEFDSQDVGAVVVKVDKNKKNITFYNKELKRKYTLEFDGTTKFYDKYGSAIVLDQLSLGDVVNISFLKSKKQLTDLSISNDTWVYTGVKDFEIDALNKNIKMQDGLYRYGEDLFVLSDDTFLNIMDINECDELTVRGNEHDIISITIEKGHGYIRLKGEESFIDGWIEIGEEKIIKTITENMLLAVPTGTYDIVLSKGNYKTVESVSIEKNKETVIDLTESSKIIDENTYGDVIVLTDPDDAVMYIDGKETDKTGPISLEYGIHQMIVKAEGYETLTQYIKVGQKSATIEVTLDKKNENSSDDKTPVPTPQITTFVTPSVIQPETAAYFVNIESPEGAEVYVDGNYVGIVPAKFAKVTGTHVVTLRKEGYQTRSYTISLDSLLQNENFSFSLLAVDKPTEAPKEDAKTDDNADGDE